MRSWIVGSSVTSCWPWPSQRRRRRSSDGSVSKRRPSNGQSERSTMKLTGRVERQSIARAAAKAATLFLRQRSGH